MVYVSIAGRIKCAMVVHVGQYLHALGPRQLQQQQTDQVAFKMQQEETDDRATIKLFLNQVI